MQRQGEKEKVRLRSGESFVPAEIVAAAPSCPTAPGTTRSYAALVLITTLIGAGAVVLGVSQAESWSRLLVCNEEIVLARVDIEPGQVIKKDMLILRSRKDLAPAGSYSAVDDVVGLRARDAIVAGSTITRGLSMPEWEHLGRLMAGGAMMDLRLKATRLLSIIHNQ
ncbi:MAG: SAF domain-containing protein [Cyanobacteria bacterium HKST-UBA02]|nr:SAF domain-containing protein [Cyanobacteria bacterium HKST-UBA02]